MNRSHRSAAAGFLLHTLSWNLSGRTSGGGVYFTRLVLAFISSFVGTRVALTRPVLQSVSSLSGWGASLTNPVLESVLSFVGRGVTLTCPVLVSVRVTPSSSVGRGFLLHAP